MDGEDWYHRGDILIICDAKGKLEDGREQKQRPVKEQAKGTTHPRTGGSSPITPQS